VEMRAATVLIGLAFGALTAFPLATPGFAAPAPTTPPSTVEGWVDTRYGPLGPGDRDLLNRVRLAGLWEMPAGDMATDKGGSERVREVGAAISEQHAQLDKLVVAAAERLGHPLPGKPNAAQQSWLAEMRAASGKEFDTVFVSRLRAAHGAVFAVIAQVRAGTRNEVVRELAQRANDFVLTHLKLLESTGLVVYASLPPPPDPAAPPSTASPAADAAVLTSGPPARGPGLSAAIWLVVLSAVAAAAAATVGLLRPR
jgi:predicted outer membrane protein